MSTHLRPRPDAAGCFTSPQLAILLGRRPQTLRKWRLQGRGPCFIRRGEGPGARVLYRVRDVSCWLEDLIRSRQGALPDECQ